MERDIEGPLAAAVGGAVTLTTSSLSSRLGVEGVNGTPTLWHRFIGELTGYSNVTIRRTVQLFVVTKLCFLAALETQDGFRFWNASILFCFGWHLYCLLASEALVRSVRRDQLLGIPCVRILGLAASNCLLFLVYLVAFWATHPEVGELGFHELPVGILIQVYPFPTSSPLALMWGVALTFIRIPMTLTWSLSLHLLISKVLGALSVPDPYVYEASMKIRRPPANISRETGGETKRHSLEDLLGLTFAMPTESSELKYRFRHFCELVERLKAVGQEVDLLATVVWCGQLVMGLLALNCLVLGNLFELGIFLTFYVAVMVLYVLYMLYCCWVLVSITRTMQFEFLSTIDKDLLMLDLESQMEIRQVVLETQLGLSVFRGSMLIDTSTIVRLLAFLASVFFVLVNVRSSKDD